jgi:putative heme-binding domain-containing protein
MTLFLVLNLAAVTKAYAGAATLPVEERDAYARFALAAPGNANRGRAVFADTTNAGCLGCHRVGSEGGDIGPDLSDVGGKLDRAHLIESVLQPSLQIVEGYRSVVVATRDGRLWTGLVKGETSETITLVDAEARTQVLRKAEVEDRKDSEASVMPESLAARLSREQFADLITYLQGLRSAATPTPGSGISGPVSLPEGFTAEKVGGGLTAATALAVAPDGRVFVCEQTGALRVVVGDQLRSEPFVTLVVDSTWERGLIGVALDPGFARNGFVYLTYVSPDPFPHHRVSRFTARGDVAEPGSEVVLLEGDDQRTLGGPVQAGHQGGALHFGVDGKLYIAIGDQTAGQPAQRLDTFQGKLLRINPDGTIPADNPFVTQTRGKYRAIWAVGLRNPYTFAIQPGTGRIFINDVGEARWEEVNTGLAGANYGWPAAEGPSDDPRYRAPIHTYKAASIAGGAFCRDGPGSAFPVRYRGKYLFMDFVKGWIKWLDPVRPDEPAEFASGLNRPVDLAFAPDGSLYVLQRNAWVIDDKFRPHTGSLLKVRYSLPRSGQNDSGRASPG